MSGDECESGCQTCCVLSSEPVHDINLAHAVDHPSHLVADIKNDIHFIFIFIYFIISLFIQSVFSVILVLILQYEALWLSSAFFICLVDLRVLFI